MRHRPESDHASDEEMLAHTLRELKTEFPRFRIVPKADSMLSRVIDVLLKVVTLGGQILRRLFCQGATRQKRQRQCNNSAFGQVHIQ
jgi:hypothetical protein